MYKALLPTDKKSYVIMRYHYFSSLQIFHPCTIPRYFLGINQLVSFSHGSPQTEELICSHSTAMLYESRGLGVNQKYVRHEHWQRNWFGRWLGWRLNVHVQQLTWFSEQKFLAQKEKWILKWKQVLNNLKPSKYLKEWGGGGQKYPVTQLCYLGSPPQLKQ